MDPQHGRDQGGSGRHAAEPMVLMATEHYGPYRWVQAPVAALALWLMISPFTLGTQSRALAVSDVASGVAALLLSIVALGRRRGLASWSIVAVGLWLLLAPLVFWAPEPAVYANDTLVGALLIVFAFLIPMGMEMSGPEVPPGWSYNPSAWSQRAPIIALAFVSFLVARYLSAYQLGHISGVWDPVFGASTERVLDSDVSRAWPVSDAGLGAVTYLIETLMGFMGDRRRWRTMPWMVAGFGVVVVPLGIVSIALVVMQPVVVGAWCGPCLFTAAAMLLMIPLTLDEVVAMVQFVARKRREGHSAWRVFWLGGDLPEDLPRHEPVRPATWRPRGMLWGFTSSWSLWLAAALGVWLMAAPDAFGIPRQSAAADSDHLVGAIVVVVAVIALAEVGRAARFLLVPLGVWLVVAPWLLDGGAFATALNSAIAGAMVGALGMRLGRVRDRYGTFDRWVSWRPRVVARAGG